MAKEYEVNAADFHVLNEFLFMYHSAHYENRIAPDWDKAFEQLIKGHYKFTSVYRNLYHEGLDLHLRMVKLI